MDGPYRVEEFGIGYCVAGLGAYVSGAETRRIADTHAAQLNAAYAAGRASVLERLRPLVEWHANTNPPPWDAEDSSELIRIVNAIAEDLK